VKTYPPEMGSAEVNAFLSHLAVEECSCIQQVFEALTTRESDDPEVASIEGCDSPQPMHLGHPEQRSVSQIHRQIAVLPHPARFLGPHRKSCRSVRGLPPEPPTAGGVLLQQVKASLANNTTAWPWISLRIRGCRDVSFVTSTLL